MYFDMCLTWAKANVKKENIKAPYVFLIGDTGCDKSFLIKTIYHILSKILSFKTVAKRKVLFLAPTSVAVLYIDSSTINSAFSSSPTKYESYDIIKLSCKYGTSQEHLKVH